MTSVFRRTIEMRSIEGSKVSEVTVTRSATFLFWCSANNDGDKEAPELGPLKLEPDRYTLSPQFDLGRLGSEPATGRFLDLVMAHLISAGIAGVPAW